MAEVYNIRASNVPSDAVNIMRPGKWGNPFVVGVHGTRNEVIDLFEVLVFNTPGMVDEIRTELLGKDLVCCCYPYACHGNVLVKVANASEEAITKRRRELAIQPREAHTAASNVLELSGRIKTAKDANGTDKHDFTEQLKEAINKTAVVALKAEQLRLVSEAAFSRRRQAILREQAAWKKVTDGLDIREERVSDGHDDVPNSATYSLTMSETTFYELLRRLGQSTAL